MRFVANNGGCFRAAYQIMDELRHFLWSSTHTLGVISYSKFHFACRNVHRLLSIATSWIECFTIQVNTGTIATATVEKSPDVPRSHRLIVVSPTSNSHSFLGGSGHAPIYHSDLHYLLSIMRNLTLAQLSVVQL